MAPIMRPPKTIDWNSPNAVHGWGFASKKQIKLKPKRNKVNWH